MTPELEEKVLSAIWHEQMGDKDLVREIVSRLRELLGSEFPLRFLQVRADLAGDAPVLSKAELDMKAVIEADLRRRAARTREIERRTEYLKDFMRYNQYVEALACARLILNLRSLPNDDGGVEELFRVVLQEAARDGDRFLEGQCCRILERLGGVDGWFVE